MQEKTGHKLRIPTDRVLAEIDTWFKYEPETGYLVRNVWGRDTIITGTNMEGYIRVYICGKDYVGHHVCWYMHYGMWPEHQIDHINRNRTDNRISNLRYATPKMQTSNLSTQSKYGRCIYYKKRNKKYEVLVRHGNVKKYLGIYRNLDEAVSIRDAYENYSMSNQLELFSFESTYSVQR